MIHAILLDNWTPPRINTVRGRHWRWEHMLKGTTAAILGCEAFRQSVPKATGRRRVTLLVTLSGRMKRPDKDAYDKLLLDALVRAGLLTDDSAKGLDGRMQVYFWRGRRAETLLLLHDRPLTPEIPCKPSSPATPSAISITAPADSPLIASSSKPLPILTTVVTTASPVA